jgi:hypothetical protein
MAFGAMKAFQMYGDVPGKTVLFSGMTTSKRAFEALQDGSLSVLAGGHFFTGAWAMLMIHDYAHGKDFANQGLELKAPLFVKITPDKIKTYATLFGDQVKQIDFKPLSKVYNSSIKKYEFGFEQFLN